MAFDVEDFIVKYDRKLQEIEDDDLVEGVTIWEVPRHGLYRVRETAPRRFLVDTLVPSGWLELIEFAPGEQPDAARALQVWFDIQTPITSTGGTTEP